MADLEVINRKILGFEVRMTIDHLLGKSGAQLVSRHGRTIDVHPKTKDLYLELRSLIDSYEKKRGVDKTLHDIKEK